MKSGRRDLNPRHSRWQRDALPLSYARGRQAFYREEGTRQARPAVVGSGVSRAYSHRMALYPLKFEPIYKVKVWGGRTLENLGRQLPAGHLIGESWEIADLGSTAGSGGGGGAERSRVANGPLAGRTLHELIREFGRLLLGTVPLNDRGEFPLLLKYLDARQNLSVQVHPSPAYARCHLAAHLKSEAWYIVQADLNAVIYKGVRDGVSIEQFRAAIEQGEVEPLLMKVAARAGECHYLPSGTCHALGAGIVVAEVQTASDTTFRVFDWGRTGRELHVDAALECIHFGPPDVGRNELHNRMERSGLAVEPKVNCEHFRIEKFTAEPGAEMPIVLNGQPAIWMVLKGEGRVVSTGGGFEDVNVGPLQTLLFPATMGGAGASFTSRTTWLQVTFPQATAGLIA
jgi:mannose-6-phosphate isomerase